MEDYTWLFDESQKPAKVLTKYAIGDIVRATETSRHKGRIGQIKEIDPYGQYIVNFPPNLTLWCEESQIEPVSELRVGDIVCVKSRKWYETNKDKYGTVPVPGQFVEAMKCYCGKPYKIERLLGRYCRLEGAMQWDFCREMFDLGGDNPNDYLETYDD